MDVKLNLQHSNFQNDISLNYKSTAGNDYGALSAIDLEFTSSIDQVCVNVSITPDDIYENAETFIVTVTSVDTQVVVQPDRETGTVTIVDEDGTSIIMDSLSAYCILNKNSI